MIELYHYKALPIRIIDGDTVELTVDQGFYNYTQQRFRLAGIDTPELNSNDETERARALTAKARVIELLPVGKSILIESKKSTLPKDKYGRWLAVIINADGINVNETLVAEGLAKVYV